MTIQQSSTSQSGSEKVKRALNHIGNAERLIASLPKIYYDQHERFIRQAVDELQQLKDRISAKLADPDE